MQPLKNHSDGRLLCTLKGVAVFETSNSMIKDTCYSRENIKIIKGGALRYQGAALRKVLRCTVKHCRERLGARHRHVSAEKPDVAWLGLEKEERLGRPS